MIACNFLLKLWTCGHWFIQLSHMLHINTIHLIVLLSLESMINNSGAPSWYLCLFSQANVEHLDRFSTKFGSEEHEDDENGQDSENGIPQKSTKPDDFELLFGGNNEDDFMIGIKFTR